MNTIVITESLISCISKERLHSFFARFCDDFREYEQDESYLLKDGERNFIDEIYSLGWIEFTNIERVIICIAEIKKSLSATTGKRIQYDISRNILKNKGADGGIFVFYDENGRFRFSFVRRYSTGTKSQYTTFKRYSFFVDPRLPNKTFKQQINKNCFLSLDKLQEAFSIEAVTDEFYKEFEPKFKELAQSVQGHEKQKNKEDFALLFVIRIIFLGFVQKKGWLEKTDFLKAFWEEYLAGENDKDSFYNKWLEPLFFEALNSPPGRKVKYRSNSFSPETESILQMAPFLNGELFKPHHGIDREGVVFIPDERIKDFMEFLFQYNFTIEENTNIDEELELSPEFLGIIFEKLVNKANGAVYTPRTEVDLMCRLSLVKWLEKNTSCPKSELFYLFFREGGAGEEYEEDQKDGCFSAKEIRELYEKLSEITVCDPAAGSGAFPVGMMQVLVDIFEKMEKQPKFPSELQKASGFDRKKMIINNCLYGAEVKQWAVWINQLRLWLSLFIDMPDDHKDSMEPLLPSLNFKIRCGDSLVQRIGGKIFPIRGHAELPNNNLKAEVTSLKKLKAAFFNNDPHVKAEDVLSKEISVFRKILESQLEELKQKLRKMGVHRNEQTKDLWNNSLVSQQELPLNKEEKLRLEAKITEIKEELNVLKRDRPFIWSIEFAEIFYERGGFDIIIGNPPYIRQEEISDPCGFVTNNKEYKELLKESIRINYPANRKQEEFFRRTKIDGKSDLYTYFYAFTLNLLNENGFHCFICSNSWLDVGFGVWLQEFLLEHCRMHYIIDNHAKRSFASADVNTIITLFEAPKNKRGWEQEQVKFVAFKRSFEESIITENLMEIEHTKETLISPIHKTYVLSHQTLKEDGLDIEKESDFINAAYIGEKWGGKYLRAPDIFTKILAKGKDKFVKLKTVADVKRGITTGCNEFFYLTAEQVSTLKLPENYIKPAILKTNEVKTISLSNFTPKGYFFFCDQEKKQITNQHVQDYIEYGENAEIEIKQGHKKGQTIKGFQNIETLNNRKLWYSLPQRDPMPILWIIAHNDRHIAFENNGFVSGDNFFEIWSEKSNAQHMVAILNSTYICLFKELYGRTNFGGGLLKTQKPDISKFLILNEEDCRIPCILLEKLWKRKTQSIFTESGIDPRSDIPIEEQEPNPLPDRKALDDVIFDALDLTEEERKDVYRAVCRLVWNRVSKAKNK